MLLIFCQINIVIIGKPSNAVASNNTKDYKHEIIILKLKRIWPCYKANKPTPRPLLATEEKESHWLKILKHVVASGDIFNLVIIVRFHVSVKFVLLRNAWVTSNFLKSIIAREVSVYFSVDRHSLST